MLNSLCCARHAACCSSGADRCCKSSDACRRSDASRPCLTRIHSSDHLARNDRLNSNVTIGGKAKPGLKQDKRARKILSRPVQQSTCTHRTAECSSSEARRARTSGRAGVHHDSANYSACWNWWWQAASTAAQRIPEAAHVNNGQRGSRRNVIFWILSSRFLSGTSWLKHGEGTTLWVHTGQYPAAPTCDTLGDL